MSGPAISVITPVYQSAAFLERCADSVRRQTFSDWELLLIDDASTDASPALCDRLAGQDRRIRAFHQARNQGVSAARNRGLEAARGECVAFLDADDQFVPETLSALWTLREQSGTDAAGCAHWNVTPAADWKKPAGAGGTRGKPEAIERESVELLLPAGIYSPEQVRERLVLPLFGERLRVPIFNGFLWRYLFSRRRIQEANIALEGAYLEDDLFLLEYFCGGGSLAVTEQPLYRYFHNPASATRHYMGGLMETLSRVMERKEALAARYDLDAACPHWRDNANWSHLLIAVGNEYARGNPKSMRERREAIQALCRRPEMARAIRAYKPAGMGRNKQLVAALIRSRRFYLLTLLYRLKNRI